MILKRKHSTLQFSLFFEKLIIDCLKVQRLMGDGERLEKLLLVSNLFLAATQLSEPNNEGDRR